MFAILQILFTIFITACSVLTTANAKVNNYLNEGTPYTNYFIIPNKERSTITKFDYGKSVSRIDYRKVNVNGKNVYVKYYLPELSYSNFNFYFLPILPNKDMYKIPMDVQNALSTRSIGFKDVNLKDKFRTEVIPYINTLENIVIGVTEEELKEIIIPNLFIQLNRDGGCSREQARKDAEVFQFSLCLIDGIDYVDGKYVLKNFNYLDEVINYNTRWLNEKAIFNKTGANYTKKEVEDKLKDIINGTRVDNDIDVIERNQYVKRYLLYLIRGYSWYCSDKFKDVELINQCVFSSMVSGSKFNVLNPLANKFGRYANDFVNFIPTTYKILDNDTFLNELRTLYKSKGHISPLHALSVIEFIDPKVMCLDLSNQDITKLNCFNGNEWTKHKFKREYLKLEEINATITKYIKLDALVSHDGGYQTDIIPSLPHVKLEIVDKYGRSH